MNARRKEMAARFGPTHQHRLRRAVSAIVQVWFGQFSLKTPSCRTSRRRVRRRWLTTESLEPRQLLAAGATVGDSVLTVKTAADKLDLASLDGELAELSLREAIHLANVREGPEVIRFDLQSMASDVIDLTLGELTISDKLRIEGAGARRLRIDAGGASRIFHIDDFDSQNRIDVEINDLTLAGGNATGPGPNGDGGAIYSLENVTIRRSYITDNHAQSLGGGVFGSIFAQTIIENSTIANNSANWGGGVVMGNQSTIHQSTLSGNHARTSAGAVLQFTGFAAISNSTITANSAIEQGGGVVSAEATTRLTSTIIAGNTAATAADLHSLRGNFSGTHNLIGDPSSAVGFSHGSMGNIVGASSANGRRPLDIQTVLDPLTLQGGAAPVHPLVLESPAIDSGASADETDQRGGGFFRNDGKGVDIGAYERQTENDLVLVVTTTEDQFDEDLTGSGGIELSLREAIQIANQTAGEFTIRFAPELTTPFYLERGEIVVTNSVNIVGNGAEVTQFDAREQSRLFNLQANQVALAISDATLRGGSATDDSATDDSATDGGATDGGAIYAEKAALRIVNATLVDNSAAGRGGAIFLGSGSIDLINATISNNAASVAGGGFAGDSVAMTLRDSSLWNNAGPARAGDQAANFYVRHVPGSVRFAAVPILLSPEKNSQPELSTSDGILLHTGSIQLVGSQVNESFELDFETSSINERVRIDFDGGGGVNTLRFLNPTMPADLTGNLYGTEQFRIIYLASNAAMKVRVSGEAVSRLSPETESIQIGGFLGSRIELTDAADWQMGSTRIFNGVFLRSLINQVNPLPRSIEVGLPRPWQNVINAVDVNNDRRVTSLDALQIINELDSRIYSHDDGQLRHPFRILVWPNQYFDVNGDGRVTAIDALIVINTLLQQSNEPTAEGERGAITDRHKDQVMVSFSNRLDPPPETKKKFEPEIDLRPPLLPLVTPDRKTSVHLWTGCKADAAPFRADLSVSEPADHQRSTDSAWSLEQRLALDQAFANLSDCFKKGSDPL